MEVIASLCLRAGEMAVIAGEYSEAIECFRNSLIIRQDGGNQVMIANCYYRLAVGYQMQENYSEAIKYNEKGLNIYQEKGYQEMSAQCYYGLGECYRMLGNYSEAITNYGQSLKIYQEKGDQEMSAQCYFYLGVCYLMLAKYSEAVTNYEQSLKIYQEKGHQEMSAQCYFYLGECFKNLAKYSEAVTNFEKSISIFQEKDDQEMIAKCYRGLGCCYRALEKHSEAVTNYEQSLINIDNLKLRETLERDVYYGLGVSLMKLYRFQESKQYLDKALNIAKQIGILHLEWICNLTLSDLHFEQNQLHSALNYAESALDIANEMNSTKEKHITYQVLGKVLTPLGRVKEAIDYLEQFLEYIKEVGNKKNEGLTCFSLSVCYRKMEDFDKAIVYAKKSAKIAKEIGDLETEGKAYGTIVDVLRDTGKLREAIEYQMKWLEIAQQSGDKKLEALAYNRLGIVSIKVGKQNDAIKYFEKCIKLESELGLVDADGITYKNLGILYYMVGKYHEADEIFKQYLDIAEKTGKTSIGINAYYQRHSDDYYKTNDVKLASECHWKSIILDIRTGDKHGELLYFQYLGECFRKTDNIKAITCQKKALDLALKIKINEFICVCYKNLGITYSHFGMMDEAIHVSENSLKMCKVSGNKENEANSRHSMGVIYHQLSRMQISCNDHVEYARIIKTSEQYYRESLQCYEEKFDDLRERNEFKISIVDTYVEAYDQLAVLLIETNRTTEALMVCERGRACALGDTLVYKYDMQQQQVFVENMSMRKPLDESDLTELLHQKSCLLFYSVIDDSEHMWVLSQQSPLIYAQNDMQQKSITNKNKKGYISQLVDSAYQFMGVRQMAPNCEDRSLGKQEPCYSHEGGDDQSQLSNSNARRPSEQDIIDIEYSRRNPTERRRNPPESTSTESDQLNDDTKEPLKELFLITPVQEHLTQDEVIIIPDGPLTMEPYYSDGDDDQSQLSNSITRRTLKQDIIESEYSRRNPNKRRRNPPESTSIGSNQNVTTKEPLKELFKQLITPVQKHLTQDEIIIIPDGPLNMVPFAALQDPKTELFLCETKRIRLAPSLTTLKTLKECPDYHSKEGALVIGNPLVGEVMFRGKKKTFSILRAAENEAIAFSQILRVSPLIGIDATKDAVKEKLKEHVAVIHIAAHGDSTTGEIALAPGISAKSKNIPEEEDYILTMQEVQETGVRAKLVVLSCCHSGRGEIRAEGVVGMARAFLAAGARAVVASLWAIDDEATLDFMAGFYNHLRRKRSASVSLNKSMKELIKEKTYSHPKYWAPFVLIGDDVTIF